jgi:thioredoxin 1
MGLLFEIKDIETMRKIFSSYSLVVLDIYADWCAPCKYLAPKLEELAKKYSSKDIFFCKLNSELGLKNDVKGLPTVEFWVKGKLSSTVMGANIDKIENTILSIVGSEKQQPPQPQPQPPQHQPQTPQHQPQQQTSGYRSKNSRDINRYKSYKNYN